MTKPTILLSNRISVYAFLSRIAGRLAKGESLQGKRILDCGAAGKMPPLAIFAEQGMDCVGIDISEPRLGQSRAFAEAQGLSIDFIEGDMRALPFEDESFDYVYETNSICHLRHADTAQAVSEMSRILKPGGLAQFGVVSRESWPLSSFGVERERGEFWMAFGDDPADEECHSMYAEDETGPLLEGWKVLTKLRSESHGRGDYLGMDDWAKLHPEAPTNCSLDAWMDVYPRRMDLLQYVHWTFLVEKPA